jgi:hypothetical protein
MAHQLNIIANKWKLSSLAMELILEDVWKW